MLQESTAIILVQAEEMQERLTRILLKAGFTKDRAMQCAAIFTGNSVDGVSTHGINRFPVFVEYVQKGYINIHAIPVLQHRSGGIEQWNGNLGPGILNAIHATNRATQLSDEYGIGCVALSNTNHWMRGGSYGWQAAKAGYMFIGWTNTIANMPAWGAADVRLGNNPLVMAIPYKDEAIVLDMAMSQFSFGAMEVAVLENRELSQPGGYDSNGKLTTDPSAIIESRRPLPVGYWKGAGLSLLLDLVATILSGGSSTQEITAKEVEQGVSQVFIAISLQKLQHFKSLNMVIAGILADYQLSIPVDENSRIVYPGERILEQRKKNLLEGIPVNQKIWNDILLLENDA